MNSVSLEIKPLIPELLDDMGVILRGSWGSTCWCMYPRLRDADMRSLPGEGKQGPRRRLAMAELATRQQSPGLLAYADGEPVGWIAIAARNEFDRIIRSRATPPVDDLPVWVIPCVTVRKGYRARGIAVALIAAAVEYAARFGAPAVEAYPRADEGRFGDDNVFFGTEPLFRRAGFHVVRDPLPNLPRNWLPRVVMRRFTGPRDAEP